MLRRALTVVLFLVVPAVGAQVPPLKGEVVFEPDLTYGSGGGKSMQLDLARPRDGAGPLPAVVCIHGGGWRAGKRQDLDPLVKHLAARGFVAVTVSYRLAPQAKFPAQIEDCKAAVRWLRANAGTYKIDPDHIGAMGFSAGGHLACLLGTADKGAGLEGQGGNPEQSSRVQAVVSFFGPTDFVHKTWDQTVESTYLIPFLGETFDKAPERYRKASPLVYVTRDDPPFLFFHGDKDQLVGIHNSEVMVKELQKVGVPARLVRMEGQGHGWAGAKLTRTLDQTVAFFREKLKK